MNLFEAIAKRHSVRKYLDKPVEREKLESIFAAVRLAPSARNAQEWRFVLVTEDGLRLKVAEAGGQPFLKECPIIVAACALTDKRVMRCGETSYPIDTAIACDHLMLAATAMGLGTCWIGSFDATADRGALGIPASVPVVALFALGYPDEEAPAHVDKNRLSIDEITIENGWI